MYTWLMHWWLFFETFCVFYCTSKHNTNMILKIKVVHGWKLKVYSTITCSQMNIKNGFLIILSYKEIVLKIIDGWSAGSIRLFLMIARLLKLTYINDTEISKISRWTTQCNTWICNTWSESNNRGTWGWESSKSWCNILSRKVKCILLPL